MKKRRNEIPEFVTFSCSLMPGSVTREYRKTRLYPGFSREQATVSSTCGPIDKGGSITQASGDNAKVKSW